MTEFRRFARFQLVVSALTALAVLMILAITGNVMASLAGFSVLALPGFRGLSFSRRQTSPIRDERDQSMERRAVSLGYSALWLFLIVWGVAIPLTFMEESRVPMIYVAPVVWVGWWLMITVRSVAVLVLDSRGS
jgi:hypothetical protein